MNMAETSTRWQERCERYFSSMLDVQHQGGKTQGAKEASKKADLYKVDNDRKSEDNGPHPHYYRRNYVTSFSGKKQPAKGLVKWLSVVDLHGTSMLLRTRSYWHCIFWIIVSLLAIGLFTLGAYLLIKEYSKSSHIFRSEFSKNGSNASPLSLLLCNSNRIRKSQIRSNSRFQGLENLTVDYITNLGPLQTTNRLSIPDLLTNTNLESYLKEQNIEEISLVTLNDINDEYSFYSAMATASDWSNLTRSLLMTNENQFPRALQMTSEELINIGHGMENSILQCFKNGRSCDTAEINYIQTRELGSCATVYLSLDNSFFDTLTLTVDVQPEDYLPFISLPPSIQVILQSSSSTAPASVSEATVVSAGGGLRLALSKRMETKRLSSQCRSDTGYNRQECVSRCQQLHTAQKCSCSISLESPLAQRCQVNQQYQFVCQRFIEVLTERNQLPCDCPPPCREESIVISKTNFEWLDAKLETLVRSSLEQNSGSWNSSSSVLKESLVRIEVVWYSAPFIKLQQEEKLELWQLFLQLGALSAITVGISVVTGVELIWLVGKALVAMYCSAVQKPKQDPNEVHRIYQPPDLHPDFDNINWRSFPEEPDMVGRPLDISDSPLNRRKCYGFWPPFKDAVWSVPRVHPAPREEGHPGDTFMYQGRDSGFVYSYDQNVQPIFQDATEAMNAENIREEDELYGRPWERTDNPRMVTSVLVSHGEAGGNDIPFLNAPGTMLKEAAKYRREKPVDYEDSDEDDLRLNLPPDLDRTRHTSGDQIPVNRIPVPTQKAISHVDVETTGAKQNAGRPAFAISGNQVRDPHVVNKGQQVKRGPDLSRFHPGESNVLPSFQQRRGDQANSKHVVLKNNKGLHRSKESMTRPLNETTPAIGKFFPRSKIVTPYTWHHSGDDILGRAFAPSAYMTSAYDGRTAIYRPQESHFDAGGSTIRNENGETFYIHS